ncbi:hypothetical protein [Hydrogenophaga sp.]|uniref:hypothetical protein n=1 Tax=Hydrogenophaga sp. TaxID=1904254 RepID=UPI003F71B1EF
MLDDLSPNSALLVGLTAGLGFLFGILTTSTGDLIKRIIERDRLISLITSEIQRNSPQANQLTRVPGAPFFARSLSEFKGVSGLSFSRIPEYNFEVYNLKLFESEGMKLALHLRSKTRAQFWETFSLMRDAEAARHVLRTLNENDPDFLQYQKMFKALLEKFDKNLREIVPALERERSWLAKIFD